MSSKSDFNTPVIALVGVVTTILTIAVILAVHVLYYTVSRQQYERKVVAVGTAESDTKLAEQEAKLTRYAWLDKPNGVAVIPIERAMELVVREAGSSPAEETPVEPPVVEEEPADDPAEEARETEEEPAVDPAEPTEDPVNTEDSASGPEQPEAPEEEQSDEG